MRPGTQPVPGGYRDVARAALRDDRELVTVGRHDGCAVVRMNEPETLNALDGPLTVQLHGHLSSLASDDSVTAVILTGADPAFSAGGDLRAMLATAHPLVDRSAEGATAMWRWIRYEFGGVAEPMCFTTLAHRDVVRAALGGG